MTRDNVPPGASLGSKSANPLNDTSLRHQIITTAKLTELFGLCSDLIRTELMHAEKQFLYINNLVIPLAMRL